MRAKDSRVASDIFFNFAGACAHYFGNDKFFDSVRFIVRSHLSSCVRCTCTSGRNIATGQRATGKYIRSIRVTGKTAEYGKWCHVTYSITVTVPTESELGITPSRKDGPT